MANNQWRDIEMLGDDVEVDCGDDFSIR